MPIYTYRCENCGVRFEHTSKFSDPPLTRCPECGKKTLRKVYLPVGIVFKGSGFYATDHRSPSGQSKFNSSDNKPSSEGKPESKPAGESSSSTSSSGSSSTPSTSSSSDSSSSSKS